MKKLSALLVSLLALVALTVFVAAAPRSAADTKERTYYVGLPPMLLEADREPVLRSILALLLKAEAGSHIEVFNAHAIERVASISVGDIPPKARVRQAASQIRAIQSFVSPAEPRSGPPNQARVPAFLSVVAAASTPSKPARVFMIASLFYTDERDPSAAFAPGFVPSDGHILAPSEQSVFGCADRKDSLKGVVIDWCVLESDTPDLERRAAERFWHLYATELGATVNGFHSSADVAAERFLAGGTTPVMVAALDRTDARLTIRPVVQRREVERPAPPPLALTPHERLKAAVESLTPVTSGRTMIAAVWTTQGGQADVDIYVRSRPGDAEIDLRGGSGVEGRLMRTRMDALNGQRDPVCPLTWEIAELDKATFGDTELWINLRSNTGQSVEGTVRVQWSTWTLDVPFTFSGTGDQGRGSPTRENNRDWRRIELPK